MKKLKVLVIGGGGRESILAKLAWRSPFVGKVFCAPGNGGTAEFAQNVDIKETDVFGLLAFAQQEKIGLTVVGDCGPLAKKIVNVFRKARPSLLIFGPTGEAARLESSKSFGKEIMRQARIPTADYEVFDDYEKAADYILEENVSSVIKADGLARGRGVELCENIPEALTAIHQMMMEDKFHGAGKKVLVETRLHPLFEYSAMAVCDRRRAIPFPIVMDHKNIQDDEKGKNCGGLGAVVPIRFLPDFFPNPNDFMMNRVFLPTLGAMAKKGSPFEGCLYAGMMVTPGGPVNLEYNVRFGDPEMQAVGMQIESDIVPLLDGSARGNVKNVDVKWRTGSSACVAMVSGGYPEAYQTGKEIFIDPAVFRMSNVEIVHAGTARVGNKLFTAGGRVLYVCVYRSSLKEAIDTAYEVVDRIYFENRYFRKNIGKKALELTLKSKVG